MDNVELIISANGCDDNTHDYLTYLRTAIPNLVVIWRDDPKGFAEATNLGIQRAKTDKIVLLNNDTVLLEQPKNKWLERLDTADIGAVKVNYSDIVKDVFAVFFCVMIQRHVFDNIGLLDTQFEVGGCEDIDFCYRALQAGFRIEDVGYKGDFPIYHAAEGTMNDEELVQTWKQQFSKNEKKLAKKHNMDHYRFLLTNNYERAVFLKGDPVFPRETQRYEWAANNLVGKQVLEIGCSTGYGYQFLPRDVAYMGLDYDPEIVEIAKDQHWGGADNDSGPTFYHADINTFELGRYNTIIAFEVIEHLDNGLEIVEKLKKHCKRLMLTVPYNEPKGFWGEHHRLHGLTEKDFPGFNFAYIDFNGNISDTRNDAEGNIANLMICWCDNE
jgi:GT2 family glycosyltransferase